MLGNISKKKAKFPEKSFIATAYDLDVPVYVSTLKDSSLALNLAVHRLKNQTYNLDFVREIIEQAAIVYNSKKSGIVTIIGEVNVGKSSLLNILVKKNISIITHKSNTTTKNF